FFVPIRFNGVMPSRTTRHAVLALVVTASLLVVAWISR
ncbi:MAG: hypothetical protein ACI80K_003079, partial [Paracoccaceae bacterium]